MRTPRTTVVGALAGLCMLMTAPVTALADPGMTIGSAQLDTSPWQARVAFASAAPVWRSGLGGFESGGFTVKRTSGVASLNLLGDYFFGDPVSDAGGLRATSGLIVAPRSQVSISQTSLPSGLFGSASRVFGSRPMVASTDYGADTSALPYFGLGYTGGTAGAGWSFSADLGLLGPRNGSAAGRLFGNAQRNSEELARDLRPMPLVQVGVLYSF